jgi:hypothetical protein
LIAVTAAKFLAEVLVFSWLSARTFTPLRRTALLMTGALARVTFWRFVVGIAGGIALPALILIASGSAAPSPFVLAAAAGVILALNFVGELLERYLFFAAVVAPKMPGAPAA